MVFRLRALLAPVVAIVLLAAGASPTPVADAAPAREDETCARLPVSSVGDPGLQSEPSGTPGSPTCWWLTPVDDGAHAFRLTNEDWFFSARLTVSDPDGAVVLDAPWGRDSALPTVRLTAGTRYRIEVGVDRGTDRGPFRVAAYDLARGCAPLPTPRWDAAATPFDISENRIACGVLETTSRTAVRLELVGDGGRMLVGMVDEDGKAHCLDRYPSGTTVMCSAVPMGRYRVVVGVGRSADDSVGLGAVPVDTTAGCTAMPLATYGEPLPVSARRAGDGAGQECYSLTAETTGPHDLRGWQPENRHAWAAGYEIWDATDDELLTQTTDWERQPLYPDQPALVQLQEGHEHRVVVTGRPFDPGDPSRPHDPRYRLGVLDRTSSEGCVPLATGWDDDAVAGRVDAGTLDCLVVDVPALTWARVDLREGGADLRPALFGRILDGSGALAGGAGAVCRFSGIGWETTASLSSSCPLGGEGPFRLLLNGTWGEDGVDYDVRAVDPTDDEGCPRLAVARWTAPLPATGTLGTGGLATDCWTFTVPRRGTYEPSMAEDVGRWAQREVQTFSATDGRPVALWDDTRPGDYRVVVAGEPGATPASYRLGVFDPTHDTSSGDRPGVRCPRLRSASVAAPPVDGVTERGGWDCHRLPTGTSGTVGLLLEAVDGGPDARAQVYDARGDLLCFAHTGRLSECRLGSSGPYRVLVHNAEQEPDETAYRLRIVDPTDRTGCLPKRVAGPNSGVLSVEVSPDGGAPCVALGDDTRQLLWSVDASEAVDPVVIDGQGRTVCTWEDGHDGPRMCHPFQFRGRPAPFTVVLRGSSTTDPGARLLLRTEPAAERGCPSPGYTAGDGPRPLRGSTSGGLDWECHVVPITDGGVVLNRRHLDGATPPDVLVFGPSGTVTCSGYGVDEVQTEPECYSRGKGARYVFWVLGSAESAGRYRVDLGCSDRRIGCAQTPEVSFSASTLRGPVRVGVRERATVLKVPPGGRVSWRWYVGGRVVRRARAYTPTRADRGKRLRLQAVVTAPRYPQRTIRRAARTVRPR